MCFECFLPFHPFSSDASVSIADARPSHATITISPQGETRWQLSRAGSVDAASFLHLPMVCTEHVSGRDRRAANKGVWAVRVSLRKEDDSEEEPYSRREAILMETQALLTTGAERGPDFCGGCGQDHSVALAESWGRKTPLSLSYNS